MLSPSSTSLSDDESETVEQQQPSDQQQRNIKLDAAWASQRPQMLNDFYASYSPVQQQRSDTTVQALTQLLQQLDASCRVTNYDTHY